MEPNAEQMKLIFSKINSGHTKNHLVLIKRHSCGVTLISAASLVCKNVNKVCKVQNESHNCEVSIICCMQRQHPKKKQIIQPVILLHGKFGF